MNVYALWESDTCLLWESYAGLRMPHMHTSAMQCHYVSRAHTLTHIWPLSCSGCHRVGYPLGGQVGGVCHIRAQQHHAGGSTGSACWRTGYVHGGRAVSE